MSKTTSQTYLINSKMTEQNDKDENKAHPPVAVSIIEVHGPHTAQEINEHIDQYLAIPVTDDEWYKVMKESDKLAEDDSGRFHLTESS